MGRKAVEHRRDAHSGHSCQAEADVHPLPDPLPLPRAEILPTEGGDRRAESRHGHPEKAVDLLIGRKRRHRVGAVGVHLDLHDQVRHRVQVGLDTGGDPDPQDLF